MFTGIIEAMGKVLSIEQEKENIIFRIQSELAPELKVDQSVAHNGVCLTVTQVEDHYHEVVVVQESLKRSCLKYLREGDKVNLERCMPANGRFDGHIVQGHVDQNATVLEKEEAGGSQIFSFSFTSSPDQHIVEKGSITVDGISLTAYNIVENRFQVSVIPYTLVHTTLGEKEPGDCVNIEFDIIGKYIHNIVMNMPKK